MQFSLKSFFEAKPEELYNAWLDSEVHSDMTGGKAIVSDNVGGIFSAWDSYISGTNIILEPYKKIVQLWRTTDFESNEDSVLEITLFEKEGGTELNLTHRNLPESGSDYRTGWIEYYFNPMKEYFSKQNES